MAKYLLLYRGGGMPETEADMAAVLNAWTNWYAGMGNSVVDPGNPTMPMAKMISPDRQVSDHPGDGMVSGYTIIEAPSLDEATNMAKTCPVLESGGGVSVFETFNIG